MQKETLKKRLKDPRVRAEIKRLASVQLSEDKIAACIGSSLPHFTACLKLDPELRQIISTARGNGVATAATALAQLVESGDFNAVKYTLVTKGGDDWNPVSKIKFEGSEELDKLMKMSAREKLAYLKEQVAALEGLLDVESDEVETDA